MSSDLNSALNNKKLQILFLIFAALLIFLGRQLDNGIQNYDDAYYAQKAKEILESGSLWLITYSGIPAFDNPPLPFWLTALAFSLFGVSTYSAIFSSALFGTGILLITYRLGLLLYKDNWVAFSAAFILLFPVLLNSLGNNVFHGAIDATIISSIEQVVFGVLIILFMIYEPLGMAKLWANIKQRLFRNK